MALRGTLTHRKTRRLARLLEMPLPCALGVMEALWHVTATHAPTGAIGRLTNQDIADEMFWEGDADALVEHLVGAELVDMDAEFRLIVHGWSERAAESVHVLLARKGQVFCDGTVPNGPHVRRMKREKAIGGPLGRETRLLVIERDGGRCARCGSTERPTADHILPVARGGTHALDNLQCLCQGCNSRKRDRLEGEW